MPAVSPGAQIHVPTESFDQDAIIATFVAGLCLETKLDPRNQVSDDIELALHQLEALKIFIWRELDPLVRFCVPLLLQHGRQMHAEHLQECLDLAFDEYTVKGHRLLMRRTLAGKTASLTEMAKEVFNPKSKEYGDYRERLRDNILFRMRDIGLWEFTEESGISKNGGLYHAGFKITAGPILLAFHRHVYITWAKQHAMFTYELLVRKGS
jgi:hypothetical protein